MHAAPIHPYKWGLYAFKAAPTLSTLSYSPCLPLQKQEELQAAKGKLKDKAGEVDEAKKAIEVGGCISGLVRQVGGYSLSQGKGRKYDCMMRLALLSARHLMSHFFLTRTFRPPRPLLPSLPLTRSQPRRWPPARRRAVSSRQHMRASKRTCMTWRAASARPYTRRSRRRS